MRELIPLGFGIVAGLIVTNIRPLRWRAIGLVVLCLVLGAFASFINGELEEEAWGLFVSFDAALVWIGALAVVATAGVWRRRASLR